MTGIRIASALALAAVLALTHPVTGETRSGGPPAGATPPPYVAGEVIVKFRAGHPGVRPPAEGGMLLSTERRELPYGAVLLKTQGVEETLAALREDPQVEFAQPNYIYRLASLRDPLWPQQWGMADETLGVQAEAAWRYTRGVPTVTVAVIDSGVDAAHPDLAGRLVPGYDFVNEDGDPADDHGHGTYVAGIIAAAAGNGVGIAGTAPGVKVLPLKAADATGSLTTADIVEAIEYAAAHGARVVNMSFGTSPNPAEPLAYFDHFLYYAIENHPDVLFVAAAGNEQNDNDALPVFPAGFAREYVVNGVRYPGLRNIVAAAALGRDGALAEFSNWGKRSVLLAAPGVEVAGPVPVREPSGVAAAVYNPGYGYRAVVWGFGAEDLDGMGFGADGDGAIRDALVRAVWGYLGISPADTAARPLLLVDDDQSWDPQGHLPDVRSFYLDPLTGAGYRTVVCPVEGGDGPSVSTAVYSGVVWFTGHATDGDPATLQTDPNLTPADRRNLAEYLRRGGRLFLSGRDACLGIEDDELCTLYLDLDLAGETYASQCAARGVGPSYEGAYYLFRLPNTYFDLLIPKGAGMASVLLELEPYEAWSGSSAAAAFTSAGAALLLSEQRELSPAEIGDILADGVTPLQTLRGKVAAAGTLNLAEALRRAEERQRGSWEDEGEVRQALPGSDVYEERFSVQRAETVQSFRALDGEVTVEIPPGALPEGATVVVRLLAEKPLTSPPNSLAASRLFGLEASAPLGKPVRVWLRFDDTRLGGNDPRCLLIFREEGNGIWVPVGGRVDRVAGAVVAPLRQFSNCAVFGLTKSFADLGGHWSKKEVELLAARGVVGAAAGDTFGPDVPITRQEAAALLVRLMELPPVEPAAPTFRDVPPGSRYYGAVEAVTRAGWLKGYGDGTFRPEVVLSREQFAAVLANVGGWALAAVPMLAFDDAGEVSPWAREAVAAVAGRGLMRGLSPTRFAPRAHVTRAQAAVAMVRMAEKMGLFEVATRVTGTLSLMGVEKPHWELETEKQRYVLIVDGADRACEALLRAYEGRRVTVTGYLLPGPDVYMRGPILQVLDVVVAP